MKKSEALEQLSERVMAVVEKYNRVKKDKEKIEAHLLKRELEFKGIKNQLEKLLKERNFVKRRIDTIIEKIDSLDV